jgi:hypothetical protein
MHFEGGADRAWCGLDVGNEGSEESRMIARFGTSPLMRWGRLRERQVSE